LGGGGEQCQYYFETINNVAFSFGIPADGFLLDPQGELPYSPRPKKGVLVISFRTKEVMGDLRHGIESKSEKTLKKEAL
jgi:hypothetical protein